MAQDYFSQRRIAKIPQDPVTREFLKLIDRETRMDISERFGIIVDYEWHCNTIANAVIESIIIALGSDIKTAGAPKAALNFYNLFSVIVTTKKNARAEKEGNINISFEPGIVAVELIENPPVKEDALQVKPIEFFKIEDDDLDEDYLDAMNDAYRNIDRHARYTLSNQYGIAIPEQNQMYSFAIAYTFISNIIRALLQDLGENPEKELTSTNFNDNIEMHALRKGEGVVIAMRPGMNAKLLIKSDDVTEEDYGDDSDDDLPWDKH